MIKEKVSLLIGGRTHQEWQSYRIDSDLLTPADDFNMTLSPGDGARNRNQCPDFIYEGAETKVMIGEDLILSGMVDTVDQTVDKSGWSLEIGGRDRASLLLDCSAPILSLQMATLDQIIKKAVLPLGIKDVEYKATPSAPRQKVQTEPGQTVWEWLESACEVNQVWPWFSPDGKLIIGAPDYTTPPVADLILKYDGDGNNIKRLHQARSLHSSFSEVTVLGQSSGSGDVGHHNIKGVAKDETLGIYRPKVVVDGNCETSELARHRAEKLMADSRMAREKLVIKVEGHRVATSTGAGKPWAPGMRVNVLSEPHGINAVYFLMRRVFHLSRAEAEATELHAVPDGVWLLNQPFVKAKRRSNFGKKKGHYVGSK